MCDQQRLISACAYAQSDQSLCSSLEYSMNVKLLTEHYLEFLSLKGGCTGSYESTLVKLTHCWKSHATAHITITHCRLKTSQKISRSMIMKKQIRAVTCDFHQCGILTSVDIDKPVHHHFKLRNSK